MCIRVPKGYKASRLRATINGALRIQEFEKRGARLHNKKNIKAPSSKRTELWALFFFFAKVLGLPGSSKPPPLGPWCMMSLSSFSHHRTPCACSFTRRSGTRMCILSLSLTSLSLFRLSKSWTRRQVECTVCSLYFFRHSAGTKCI